MKNPKNLNSSLDTERSMKFVARAGLGFISGLFALWGANSLLNQNWILGIIALIVSGFLFYYAWKG